MNIPTLQSAVDRILALPRNDQGYLLDIQQAYRTASEMLRKDTLLESEQGGFSLAELMEAWEQKPIELPMDEDPDDDLVEADEKGFTGTRKDKRGRIYCLDKGKRTKCSPEQLKKAQEDFGGSGTSSPDVPQQPKKEKQAKPSASDAQATIKAVLDSDNLTDESVGQIAAALKSMTVKDITALKQQMGLKASGKKEELIQKIAQRAVEGARKAKEQSQGPKQAVARDEAPVARDETPVQREDRQEDKLPVGEPKQGTSELKSVEQSPKQDAPVERQGKKKSNGIDSIGALLKKTANMPYDKLMDEMSNIMQSGWDAFSKNMNLPDGADIFSVQDALYSAKGDPDKFAKKLQEEIGSRDAVTGKVRNLTPLTISGMSESTEHINRIFTEGIKRGGGSSSHQKKMSASAQKAIEKMPQFARERMASNLKKITFSASQADNHKHAIRDLSDVLQSDSQLMEYASVIKNVMGIMGDNHSVEKIANLESDPPALLSYIKTEVQECIDRYKKIGKDLGGCYNLVSTSMILSPIGTDGFKHIGPQEFSSSKGDSTTAVMAHEFGHAIDGPNMEFSSSSAWKEVVRTEINQAKLTSYADTGRHEAWAEFCRLVYGGQVELSTVEKSFPKASNVFKENGLWPTSQSN